MKEQCGGQLDQWSPKSYELMSPAALASSASSLMSSKATCLSREGKLELFSLLCLLIHRKLLFWDFPTVVLCVVGRGYESQMLMGVEETNRHMHRGGTEGRCDQINLRVWAINPMFRL